jgi:hypothetical protein
VKVIGVLEMRLSTEAREEEQKILDKDLVDKARLIKVMMEVLLQERALAVNQMAAVAQEKLAVLTEEEKVEMDLLLLLLDPV